MEAQTEVKAKARPERLNDREAWKMEPERKAGPSAF